MQECIDQARRGDERALDYLYVASRERVFRLALAILGDPETAEEVMQDTLHYALAQLERFDPQRSAWTTWLHMITVSRARDRLRRRRWATVPLFGSLMAGEHVEQRVEQRELTGALHAALLELPEKLREAVALRFVEELGYAEIGAILGCPAKTAQSRVRLGLERLRRLVDENPDFSTLRLSLE